MITSVDVRSSLVKALEIDLVGPTDADSPYKKELLTQTPSKWYLTGFLAPHGSMVSLDEMSDESVDQLDGGSGSEDGAVPEPTASRKAPFPASMGLSFFISTKTTELHAIVQWGDYYPTPIEDDEEATEEGSKKPKKEGWQRVPHQIELTIPVNTANTTQKIPVPGSRGLALIITSRSLKFSQFPTDTYSVSVFLVNYREARHENRDEAFIFQACLTLKNEEGFLPKPDPRGCNIQDWDEAVAHLHYRNDFEYAVGHNVSAIYCEDEGRCQEIQTTWVPASEVPRVQASPIDNVQLGMESIAEAPDAKTLQAMIGPIVTAYGNWIKAQSANIPDSPAEVSEIGTKLLERATIACDRIAAGLNLLTDPQVFEAFRLANRVIAMARRQQLKQEQPDTPPESFKQPEWRPFQIAFILLNLRSIANPEHPDRQVVDLLFFPTGGGKTEAYLGLAAFTLLLRRLRYPGVQSCGVSVLMRYTLRLLTLDQLERASRLICALELERQKNPGLLGSWPFEIGLWVGQSATPNRMGKKGDNDEYTARSRTLKFQRDSKSNSSPIPLERCPWCGEKFKESSFNLYPNSDAPKSLRITCKRPCEFTGNRALPIIAVDETIYRRLPCFMIATVDKFASLPWVGQTGALFGRVTHFQEADGFYGPADNKKEGKTLGAYLPPPDLVIQDELHLISGPLGTMVGLYETAIDALCTREVNGSRIQPKIIASTATVRRAHHQIQALFNRHHVDIFPPPGPNRHDSFFAHTVPVTKENPGRLYLGVAAQGRSLKVVLLRAYLALLAAAQKQWQETGGKKNTNNPADPYMTLLGYFNSLRELGGSRRIIEDEVVARLAKYGDQLRHGETEGLFANRKISDDPEELTSRVNTSKVAATKRCLALPFHDDDSIDVALATNMISVGLDITRLGLMVVLGQPIAAAEYIQATSRVGRVPTKPGLVVTLLNIHRPRDRSHYERFQAWHTSFYRAVEATSVTPFSPRALDRGLAGVTVALARLGVPQMTSPMGASLIDQYRSDLDRIAEEITQRVEGHNPDLPSDAAETLRQEVRTQIQVLFDTWTQIADREKRLQYYKDVDAASPLLLDALDPRGEGESSERQAFRAQRSLRDVEPTVALFVRDPSGLEVEEESV